jgi:putative peptide zinc metalloprotease protein
VISDLIGVPDLFARIGPTLRSLVWGRPRDPRVAGLRPLARVVVVAWVLLTLACMCFLYFLLVVGAPRLLATAQQSFLAHAAALYGAAAVGNVPVAILAAVDEVLLVLPLAAIALSVGGMAKTVVVGGWRYSNRRPVARAVVLVGSALLVGFAAGFGVAHRLYSPIQPWERGTVPATAGAGIPIPAPPAVEGRAFPSPKTVRQSPTATPLAPSPAPSGTQTGGGATTSSPIPTQPAASPTPDASPVPSPSPSDSPSPSPSPTASP